MSEPAENLAGWATVTELARLRGVNKSAISKRVGRLESLGALHTKAGARRTKLISVAEFERAVGETTDSVRELNGKTAQGVASPSDPVLPKEQARRAAIVADLAQLDLDERLGKLVRVDELAAGAALHGETLSRIIDQIADRADDFAGVVAKDGAPGLRVALRGLARELRAALADAFAALAQAPPEASAEAVGEVEAVA